MVGWSTTLIIYALKLKRVVIIFIGFTYNCIVITRTSFQVTILV